MEWDKNLIIDFFFSFCFILEHFLNFFFDGVRRLAQLNLMNK